MSTYIIKGTENYIRNAASAFGASLNSAGTQCTCVSDLSLSDFRIEVLDIILQRIPGYTLLEIAFNALAPSYRKRFYEGIGVHWDAKIKMFDCPSVSSTIKAKAVKSIIASKTLCDRIALELDIEVKKETSAKARSSSQVRDSVRCVGSEYNCEDSMCVPRAAASACAMPRASATACATPRASASASQYYFNPETQRYSTVKSIRATACAAPRASVRAGTRTTSLRKQFAKASVSRRRYDSCSSCSDCSDSCSDSCSDCSDSDDSYDSY